jgi:hypothetical protein
MCIIFLLPCVHPWDKFPEADSLATYQVCLGMSPYFVTYSKTLLSKEVESTYIAHCRAMVIAYGHHNILYNSVILSNVASMIVQI